MDSQPDFISACLGAADEHNASDLFLAEDEVPRLKIDGRILLVGEHKITMTEMVAFWTACGADPVEGHDFDTGIFSASGTRFRVNLHRSMGRLGCVMRRVKSEIPPMEELGVPVSLLRSWMGHRSGLILVTGPTGSGKSTTLGAMIDWVNQTVDRHIVTVEDPIEYLFTNKQSFFTQREVGRDTRTFQEGLRASLRQAPDVILVGEIRDAETALTSLQAAETGHLVLSTLHSEKVSEAMERLLNLFPAQSTAGPLTLLSNQLLGIMCQKLVPRKGGGMKLVVEHFENIGATRDWIRSRSWDKLQDTIDAGATASNRSFLKSVVEAFKAGEVEEEAAISACGNEMAFRRAVRGIS
jgi:pilus retraction protein PilT